MFGELYAVAEVAPVKVINYQDSVSSKNVKIDWDFESMIHHRQLTKK